MSMSNNAVIAVKNTTASSAFANLSLLKSFSLELHSSPIAMNFFVHTPFYSKEGYMQKIITDKMFIGCTKNIMAWNFNSEGGGEY